MKRGLWLGFQQTESHTEKDKTLKFFELQIRSGQWKKEIWGSKCSVTSNYSRILPSSSDLWPLPEQLDVGTHSGAAAWNCALPSGPGVILSFVPSELLEVTGVNTFPSPALCTAVQESQGQPRPFLLGTLLTFCPVTLPGHSAWLWWNRRMLVLVVSKTSTGNQSAGKAQDRKLCNELKILNLNTCV